MFRKLLTTFTFCLFLLSQARASCSPEPAYAIRAEVLECRSDAEATTLFNEPMLVLRVVQKKQRIVWPSGLTPTPTPIPDTVFLMKGKTERCPALQRREQNLFVPQVCCDTIPEGGECHTKLHVAVIVDAKEVDGT